MEIFFRTKNNLFPNDDFSKKTIFLHVIDVGRLM